MKRLLIVVGLFSLFGQGIGQDLTIYYQVNTFLDHDEINLYAFNRGGRNIELRDVQLALLFDSLQSFGPGIIVDKVEEAFKAEEDDLREHSQEAYVELDRSVQPPVERRSFWVNGAILNYVWNYRSRLSQENGNPFQLPADGAMKEVMSIRFAKHTPGLEADFYLADKEAFSGARLIDIEGNNLSFEVALVSSVTYPVDWLSFEGWQQGAESVELQWTTAKETNNSHFQVERSLDGRVYTSIGQVATKGNSDNLSEYTFVDPKARGNRFYYRIRQQDVDGLFSFSNTVMVLMEAGKDVQVQLSPNPTHDFLQLTLMMSRNEKFDLWIVDPQGRVVFEKENIGKEEEHMSLNVGEYKAGIYRLVMKNRASHRLVSKGFVVVK